MEMLKRINKENRETLRLQKNYKRKEYDSGKREKKKDKDHIKMKET